MINVYPMIELQTIITFHTYSIGGSWLYVHTFLDFGPSGKV